MSRSRFLYLERLKRISLFFFFLSLSFSCAPRSLDDAHVTRRGRRRVGAHASAGGGGAHRAAAVVGGGGQ